MISDLPHDLESEILSRVPAKSLVRLKTTCKRWYGLFRDPRFIENNKKLGKSVMESMLLLNSRVYSIDEDLHSLHNRDVNPKPIYFPGTLCSLKHSSKYLKIFHIYHCEGLMLCTTKGNTRLMVWNPCTGQKRRIKPRTCYRSDDRHAMGYVVNRKSSSSRLSYKILRFCNYKNDQKVQVAEFDMYELSSHSWRVHDHLTHDYEIYSHGVSLKGNTYWVAKDEETGFFMLKFDFTTERFVRLPFPFQSFDFIEEFAVLSVVRDEKLSLLHYLQWSNVMKIWVTNKIDKEAKDLSWRSDFTLVLNLNKFSCVTNVSSFLLDEENKVAICCDVDIGNKCNKTIIYVVGEDMYENVYKEIPEKDSIAKALGERLQHVDWPLVLTYVPSLVHIEKKTSKRRKKRRLALE